MNILKKLLLPLFAVLGLLLTVGWMAGLFSERMAPGLADSQPASIQDTRPATAITQPLLESVPATVRARETTDISSRILSRITKIAVRSGDRVRQGQLLVTLEQASLQSRAAQTAEQIKGVRARLAEASSNLNRTRDLHQRKLVANADLERAQANFDALSADLASAQQTQQEALAALSYTRIEAPIDGIVVDRFAEPGDTASPGTRLLSIYNPSTLRIEAPVREHLALALTQGQELEVTIPALNRKLKAVLEELIPSADTGSRTFLIKARIDGDKRLLPGMYGELKVPAGEEKLLLVDSDRIAHIGQLNLVWVAGNNGIEQRFVRLGRRYPGDKTAVLSGLQEGDLLLPPAIN